MVKSDFLPKTKPKNKVKIPFDNDWLKDVSLMESKNIENIKAQLQSKSQPFLENKANQNNVKTEIINELFQIVQQNQIENKLLVSLLQTSIKDMEPSMLNKTQDIREHLMSLDILSLDDLVQAVNNITEIIEAANVLLSLKMNKNNMDTNNNTANTNVESIQSNLTNDILNDRK